MDGEFEDEPFIYRLNDNGSGPSLLVKVFSERGWRLYQGPGVGDEQWNLWWRTSTFSATSYNALEDWQFVNHIPKGGSICRKDNLSRLLRCMRKIYGPIYDISPPSFHLPLEYAKLVSECSRLRRGVEEAGGDVVWIHKPVGQSQGRGIFLFRNICDMRCGTAAVVQRYIERPLLMAGYKFDLRLYVCVPAYRPLTAYMYAEGLARFGTDKYTLSDIHNPYRHLTNSSLNKSGPRYSECKDRIGNGCKWTLKQVRHALIGRWGAQEWLVWQRIRSLVTLTLLAQVTGTPPTRNCFEFYGFDVLLDDRLKPWLLEVNISPALAADCEADVAVKRPMLHELFDLVGLPVRNTGLATLHATPVSTHHSGSEDEGGHSPPPRVTSSTHRAAAAGRRVRRKRQTLPVHCVNLRPAIPDKLLVDVRDTFNDTSHDGKAEFSEEQQPSLVSPNENPDDFYRHPSNPTTKRRVSPCQLVWGNGIQWDKAPPRVGNWVRIFPLSSEDQVQKDMETFDDVREAVSQVSRFSRATREVVRESDSEFRDTRYENRDERFLVSLREKLSCGHTFQVWIPPY